MDTMILKRPGLSGFHLGMYLRLRTKMASLDDLDHIRSYFSSGEKIVDKDLTVMTWENCFKKVANSTTEENFELMRVDGGINVELAKAYNLDIEEQYKTSEGKGLRSLPLNLIKFHERLFGKVPYCFGFSGMNIRCAKDIMEVEKSMREFTIGDSDGLIDPEILAGLMKKVVHGNAEKVSIILTPLVQKCIVSDILTARQFGFIELMPLLHIYLYGEEPKAQVTSLSDSQVISMCKANASSFNISAFCSNALKKFPCESTSCSGTCGVCSSLE